MAVSLNSVIPFTPPAGYKQVTKGTSKALLLKIPSTTGRRRPRLYILASGGDNAVTKATDKNEESPSTNAVNASTRDEKGSSDEAALAPQTTEVSNGSANGNQSGSGSLSAGNPRSTTLKKSSLTARERLRAARVLNRYNESSKPSKPELGSRLLDAIKETDKGKKRSGLPEAPTNLFDDSKRGLPKDGWTFSFPGGTEAFFIAVSFVLISSVMFATTYIVWKVGAIHFNE